MLSEALAVVVLDLKDTLHPGLRSLVDGEEVDVVGAFGVAGYSVGGEHLKPGGLCFDES